MPQTKTCTKCNQELLLQEFSCNPSHKDGLNYTCKACARVYLRDHYKKNKQYYIQKAAERRKRCQDKFNRLKINLKCIKCGQDHPATLDFHHRDPSQKEAGIARYARSGISHTKLQKELDKCDVLCANCHRILHYEKSDSS